MRLMLPFLTLAACKGTKIDCDDYGLDIPSVRGELTAAWDEERDRMVFFGGNDDVPENCEFGATNFRADTWEYSRTCNAFREIPVEQAPPPRGRHATTSDGERMYMGFGRYRDGRSGAYELKNDLWAFDFRTDTWELLSDGAGPAPRSNTAFVYLDGKIWMFGGNTSSDGGFFEPRRDLWYFDLETRTWTWVDAPNGPSRRLFHAMATDGEMIYVYGGGDENAFLGPFLDDLWAYDPETNQWTEMLHGGPDPNGPAKPLDRFWANLEYDPVLDALILFGGHDNTELGNTNQVYHYSLSEGRWYRDRIGDEFNTPGNGFCDFPADFVTIDVESPERRNAGASVMTGDGKMLIFGGKTDCGLINDVWSYDVATTTWTELSPATSGQACLRANQAGCTTLCY